MAKKKKKKATKKKATKKKVAKKKVTKKKATKKKATKKKVTKKKVTKKKATKKKTTKKKVSKKKTTKKKASKKKAVKKKVAKKATKAKKSVPKKKPAPKKLVAKASPKKDWNDFFVPLDDRILIKAEGASEKTAGGIIIPDMVQNRPNTARVLSVGPGHRNEKGFLKTIDINVGDQILMSDYTGQKLELQGEDVIIIRESEVLGVID